MTSPRLSFFLLSIGLYLSTQQIESSAFSWTENLYRKIRKNQSRFQPASISASNLNQMWKRPGLEVIRVGASRSSSESVDDGDSDYFTKQSPTYSIWWRKDPRNRSVSGILICMSQILLSVCYTHSILRQGAFVTQLHLKLLFLQLLFSRFLDLQWWQDLW